MWPRTPARAIRPLQAGIRPNRPRDSYDDAEKYVDTDGSHIEGKRRLAIKRSCH
ncbi:MAG: hypothetical protein JWN96_1804, partial [Mycobacterium sp.]|nr:hypothetical protein [Mycobacterium sp.]